MKPSNNTEFEKKESEFAQISPSEVFLNTQKTAEIWPEIYKKEPAFKEQIKQHVENAKIVNEVIDCLPVPNLSLEDAVKFEILSESQVSKLYESLCNNLNDSEYKRLVLYLPFEFLPNESWVPKSDELFYSTNKFKSSYMDAWFDMLFVQDVRANFVDGDVIETDRRTDEPERVVKACHLIPKLYEKGMIKTDEIIELLKTEDDQLLISGITDAFFAMLEMGQISENEFNDILGPDAKKTEKLHGPGLDDDITERRKWWLQTKHRQEEITEKAKDISRLVNNGTSLDEAVPQLIEQSEDNKDEIIVESIRNIIENKAKTNIIDAKNIYDEYRFKLISMLNNCDINVHEQLEKTFRRLHKLGIVDAGQLKSIGIDIPTLSGPVSENLSQIPGEVEDIIKFLSEVKINPELEEYIFQVAIIGGSKIKGYGKKSSDIDVSVFIKPDIPESSKDQMRKLFESSLKIRNQDEKPMEFWLKENSDKFEINGSNKTDRQTADNLFTHVLFDTVWLGDKDTIKELMNKVLTPYFYEDDSELYGQNIRQVYIEKIEQDLLQYRLLHNGYDRHYPSNMDEKIEQADSIDGDSTFWDSGYRQLATKLYINSVFLPKIKNKAI